MKSALDFLCPIPGWLILPYMAPGTDHVLIPADATVVSTAILARMELGDDVFAALASRAVCPQNKKRSPHEDSTARTDPKALR